MEFLLVNLKTKKMKGQGNKWDPLADHKQKLICTRQCFDFETENYTA